MVQNRQFSLLLGFHPVSNLTFPLLTQNFNLPGSDPNYVLNYSETYLGFSKKNVYRRMKRPRVPAKYLPWKSQLDCSN